MNKLVVLQRPGEVPVTVHAQGNAVLLETGKPRIQKDRLEFRGLRP